MIVMTSVGLANTGTLCGLDPFSPTGAQARSEEQSLKSLRMRLPALAPTDPLLQQDVQLWVGVHSGQVNPADNIDVYV